MTRFGFIDESGVNPDQQIMTVGLVTFDGQFTAKRLQTRILETLYPKRAQKGKKVKLGDLHYTELEDYQREAAAEILQTEKISFYGSYYYHESGPLPHEERTAIYRSMVSACILNALDDHKVFDICVAQQGSDPEYHADTLKALKEIPARYREYRKVTFRLGTNAKPGIQLADFYVGALRDHHLSELLMEPLLAKPYSLIELHTVGDIYLEPTISTPIKAKG